jgi:FkbM family methyltransferase
MKTKILPIEFVSTRKKYVLFKNDCGVTDVVRNGGIYENYIFDFIKDNIKVEGKNIIDIGANLGFHSLEFADLVGDTGIVYAFEPQRLIYYQLCSNIILNGYDNIYAYNVALGDRNEVVLIENADYYSNETINIGNAHINAFTNNHNNKTQLVKLDDYNFKDISIIKIDVQGYEPYVIDGAVNTIIQNQPFIFIEVEYPQLQVYGFTVDDVFNRLVKLGYTIKKIKNETNIVDYVGISSQIPIVIPEKIVRTYKDVNGWFGFEKFYANNVTRFLKDHMNIVEIGVFDGKSVCFLADFIKKNQLKINFYAVDHWIQDEEYNRFIQNLKDCDIYEFVNPVRLTSEKASQTFEDNFFDFIFIDGLHDYDSVKNDINYWFPKLKPGGIIGGDDYDPCWDGVRKAVDERFGDRVIKMWPAWYLTKE